jgi:hypothetical protein
MKKLLGLVAVLVALGAVRRLVARWPRGFLLEKIEAAIEQCPPMVAMRRLGEQNEEVISLLREQNALLRREPAARERVAGVV